MKCVFDWRCMSIHINRVVNIVRSCLKMNLKARFARTRESVRAVSPIFWQKYYMLGNGLSRGILKFRTKLFGLIVFVLFATSWFWVLKFNTGIERYFSVDNRLGELHTLFITLGAALVTVSVIAFSFIMFAMQVNVERMPYGLFRKLSSDKKLLAYFLLVFILSLLIGFFSIIGTNDLIGISIISVLWGIFIIVFFLLAAFNRALKLISPTEQLKLILESTKNELNAWAKVATRVSPLLAEKSENDEIENTGLGSRIDTGRFVYFSRFPQWTQGAEKAIHHAFLLASYHASHGDYESSEVAMITIVRINEEYIKAKGKTFIADNSLINTGLSGDKFITETMEGYRKYAINAVARGDEQQILQGFDMMRYLFFLYFSIDYSTVAATKNHADLAITYLSKVIESIVPHALVDVLMSGIRVMGEMAIGIISQGELESVDKLSEKISLISSAGIIHQNMQPVIYIGVEQLAKIEFALIRSPSSDISYMVKTVHSNLCSIARLLLTIKEDNPLQKTHSYNLGCYYSVTSYEALISWLNVLTNVLLEEKETYEVATIQRIISHLLQWSENLCQTEKELLLLAIKKKSTSMFDIISWIIRVSTIILAISTIDSCRDDNREALIKNAYSLVHIISYIPDDKEAVLRIAHYDLTSQLFRLVIEAKNRDNLEFALKIKGLLLSWAFKMGKYGDRWRMAQALCGLVCLNLLFDLDNDCLLSEIEMELTKIPLDDKVKEALVGNIKEKAEDIIFEGFSPFNAIDVALKDVDQEKKRILLLELAEKFK